MAALLAPDARPCTRAPYAGAKRGPFESRVRDLAGDLGASVQRPRNADARFQKPPEADTLLHARARPRADVMSAAGVTDVVSLVTDEEMKRRARLIARVACAPEAVTVCLLTHAPCQQQQNRHKCTTVHAEMRGRGWTVHSMPQQDGEAPSDAQAAELVRFHVQASVVGPCASPSSFE
jgi:hypothetical protein